MKAVVFKGVGSIALEDIPILLESEHNKQVNLTPFLTKTVPFYEVINAYKHFDKREEGWLKVALVMNTSTNF